MGLGGGEPASTGIRFTSFLSENALEFYRQVADYAGQSAGLPVLWVPAAGGLRAMLAAGEVEAAFTCGLPFVLARGSSSASRPPVLLAAPVLADDRYGGRPIYFSDFIVRAEADLTTFEALRGASFAYNELESLSGDGDLGYCSKLCDCDKDCGRADAVCEPQPSLTATTGRHGVCGSATFPTGAPRKNTPC